MFQGKPGRAIRPLDVLWTSGTLTGLTDAQLLSRFVQTRDAAGEMAFRELVDRHGPMVQGVCRQILRHSHDADDAFQATFLVLVRKAHAIKAADSLAPWLYSVACRTAQRARATAARYRPGGEEAIEDVGRSSEDVYTLDLRPLLYQELGRLPVNYRAPIVLCHLEGKTHEEAARLLGWPVGTVSGRLSRGRQLLRARLERRGVAVPSAVFAAAWLPGAHSAVTTRLVECTLGAATRFAAAQTIQTIPASVLCLTQGVLRTMFLRKLSTISAIVLLVGAVSGAGVWAHWVSPSPRHAAQPSAPPAISIQDPEAAPVPSANPAPSAKPQPAEGAPSVVADNCPADDCPLTRSDDDRPNCPLSMAANALRGVLGHVSLRSPFSR